MTPAALPRRLDRAEAFFWFLDRVSSMNFAVVAEGRGTLTDAAVRAALDAAQRRHPLLRVSIAADAERRLSFVPAPHAPIPYGRCTDADWRDALAERLVQPFALDTAPLARAWRFARDDDGGWVLALVLHHSIGDARSAFAVLDEILQGAAGLPPAGGDIAPRAPLTDLYPAHVTGDAGRQLGEQTKVARKALAERIGLPEPQAGHGAPTGRLQPRLRSLRFDAAQTAALAGKARAVGATVNGLIGAAQLIALRRLFGDATPRTLGLTCAADLRPYLSAPMDATTPGFYVTLVSSIQRVGDADELWPLAQRLSGAIRQQLQSGAAHLLYDFMPPAERFAPDAEGVAAFAQLMTRGVQTSLLSNAGRLAALPALPGLVVEARSFALCPTPTQPIFLAVATDAGGMMLNLNHNTAQLDAGTADAVLAGVRELLLAA